MLVPKVITIAGRRPAPRAGCSARSRRPTSSTRSPPRPASSSIGASCTSTSRSRRWARTRCPRGCTRRRVPDHRRGRRDASDGRSRADAPPDHPPLSTAGGPTVHRVCPQRVPTHPPTNVGSPLALHNAVSDEGDSRWRTDRLRRPRERRRRGWAACPAAQPRGRGVAARRRCCCRQDAIASAVEVVSPRRLLQAGARPHLRGRSRRCTAGRAGRPGHGRRGAAPRRPARRDRRAEPCCVDLQATTPATSNAARYAAHRRGARAAAPADRRGGRDRRARLQPARRRHQGRRPRRGDGLRGRRSAASPTPSRRPRPAGRQPRPPRAALRARRGDHRLAHRLPRPRRAAVGPAAVVARRRRRPPEHGQVRGVGHADPRSRSPARSAPRPRCTGSAWRAATRCAVVIADADGSARGRSPVGVRRRRHQARLPRAHPARPRGAHHDHAIRSSPTDGWRPLGDLGVGVPVAVPPRCRSSVTTRCPPPRSSCSRYLVGHGHRVAGGSVFASTAPAVVADLVVHADGAGVRDGSASRWARSRTDVVPRQRRPRPHRDRRRSHGLLGAAMPAWHPRCGAPAPAASCRCSSTGCSPIGGSAARWPARWPRVASATSRRRGRWPRRAAPVASLRHQRRRCVRSACAKKVVTHDLFEVEITEAADIRAFS